MQRLTGRILVAGMSLPLVCGLAAPALASPGSDLTPVRISLGGRGRYIHHGSHGEVDVNLCSDDVAAGAAHCDAHIRTDLLGKDVQPLRNTPAAPGAPTNGALLGNQGAYDPAYLQSAYNAPSTTGGAGQTVAVIDAYDAPHIEADLAAYRSQFGLPACTTANGCFTKINETGGTTYPAGNTDWATETSLDVDMVSALCPQCHILLVEATSASFGDLGQAVNDGRRPGRQRREQQLRRLGVLRRGATRFGLLRPPGRRDRRELRRQRLRRELSRRVAVRGCSRRHQPCTRRPTPARATRQRPCGRAREAAAASTSRNPCGRPTRVAAAARSPTCRPSPIPNTGVWVYDSDAGGWEVFGGTSVAAPIVGAMYALAGNGPSNDTMDSLPYATPSASERRRVGKQRKLWWLVSLHRHRGLRRADRSGHAEHGRRVHSGWIGRDAGAGR